MTSCGLSLGLMEHQRLKVLKERLDLSLHRLMVSIPSRVLRNVHEILVGS